MNIGDYRAVGRAAAMVPTPQGYPLEKKWELHALRVNPDHKCLESKKVKGERLGWHREDSSSLLSLHCPLGTFSSPSLGFAETPLRML